MVKGFEGKLYEKQLRSFALFSPEEEETAGRPHCSYNFLVRIILVRTLQEGIGLDDFSTWTMGFECILGKFVNTELCGVANMLEGRDVIPSDLERLKGLVCANPIRLNKVMEEIILSAITWHMQDNRGFKPSKHGFTKGRSCLTNLISFYDKLNCLVDDGRTVDIVYLDFMMD
ncbi:hypothetical protein WISP_149736 [Willisornis vidua]|uniref:Rna-directed dna polymerase from mobile element jockey-like n=1 Tax=Willisornis vidua TaxID=1566151 RepID=A0ABQ9CQ94_9PASS|nr:hypothetical protein WISP_149736 [Willisornis vidua]